VVPVGVGAQACFRFGVVQVTGQFAEVAGHVRFIVQVADRNLNDGGSARTKALRFTCGNRATARVVPTLLSPNLQILPATNLLLPLSPQCSVFCVLSSQRPPWEGEAPAELQGSGIEGTEVFFGFLSASKGGGRVGFRSARYQLGNWRLF
jgi:hypothetical protein